MRWRTFWNFVRRRRADALRRRVGRDERRVLLLERFQLVVGAVVGRVVDGRVVEHVVLVQPAVELRDGARRRGLQSELGKELLGRVDDDVGVAQCGAVVDPPPGRRRPRRGRRLSRPACRRASRRRTRRWSAVASSRSSASWSGAGFGLCRSVSSPPTTVSKKCAIGSRAKARSTVARRLAVTRPRQAALVSQGAERRLDAGERLELVVERLVVRAVDADELIDAIRGERLHLRLQARPTDVRHQLLSEYSRPAPSRSRGASTRG